MTPTCLVLKVRTHGIFLFLLSLCSTCLISKRDEKQTQDQLHKHKGLGARALTISLPIPTYTHRC
jgi:hypothetical protein